MRPAGHWRQFKPVPAGQRRAAPDHGRGSVRPSHTDPLDLGRPITEGRAHAVRREPPAPSRRMVISSAMLDRGLGTLAGKTRRVVVFACRPHLGEDRQRRGAAVRSAGGLHCRRERSRRPTPRQFIPSRPEGFAGTGGGEDVVASVGRRARRGLEALDEADVGVGQRRVAAPSAGCFGRSRDGRQRGVGAVCRWPSARAALGTSRCGPRTRFPASRSRSASSTRIACVDRPERYGSARTMGSVLDRWRCFGLRHDASWVSM